MPQADMPSSREREVISIPDEDEEDLPSAPQPQGTAHPIDRRDTPSTIQPPQAVISTDDHEDEPADAAPRAATIPDGTEIGPAATEREASSLPNARESMPSVSTAFHSLAQTTETPFNAQLLLQNLSIARMDRFDLITVRKMLEIDIINLQIQKKAIRENELGLSSITLVTGPL